MNLCIFCKVNEVKKTGKRFCSHKCYSKSLIGSKLSKETIRKIVIKLIGVLSNNWKGGCKRDHSNSSDKTQRVMFRKEIQKKVFERDDYTCQICGERGGDLQVDHIQEWSKYVELRFEMNNCRTLCAKCHYKITYGKPMPPEVRAWGHNLLGGKLL